MKKLLMAIVILFAPQVFALQNVPEIHITNLQGFAGTTLSVFYVSGSMSLMGLEFPGQKPRVSYILSKLIDSGKKNVDPQELSVTEIPLDNKNEVTIPAAKLQKAGLRIANLIVFVIHKQKNVFLRSENRDNPKEFMGEKGDSRLLEDHATIKDAKRELSLDDFKFECMQTHDSLSLKHLADPNGVVQLKFDPSQCWKFQSDNEKK
jgi:hypothetical protein